MDRLSDGDVASVLQVRTLCPERSFQSPNSGVERICGDNHAHPLARLLEARRFGVRTPFDAVRAASKDQLGGRSVCISVVLLLSLGGSF